MKGFSAPAFGLGSLVVPGDPHQPPFLECGEARLELAPSLLALVLGVEIALSREGGAFDPLAPFETLVPLLSSRTFFRIDLGGGFLSKALHEVGGGFLVEELNEGTGGLFVEELGGVPFVSSTNGSASLGALDEGVCVFLLDLWLDPG